MMGDRGGHVLGMKIGGGYGIGFHRIVVSGVRIAVQDDIVLGGVGVLLSMVGVLGVLGCDGNLGWRIRRNTFSRSFFQIEDV